MKRSLNGLISVVKSRGQTTNSLVYSSRKYPGVEKAGQAGTLDPIATGVVVLAFGEATKLIPYLDDTTKTYIVQFELGASSNTLDTEGVVTRVECTPPEREVLENVLFSFTGKVKQIPPAHSAVKINGRPAYKYARKNIQVEPPERTVFIHEISIKWRSKDGLKAAALVTCSRGTYIRSLVRDIGIELGCGAVMTKLSRLRSGSFTMDGSLSFRKFRSCIESGTLEEHLTNMDEAPLNVPKITLTDERIDRSLTGLHTNISPRDLSEISKSFLALHAEAQNIKVAVQDRTGHIRFFAELDCRSDVEYKIVPRRVLVRPELLLECS